MLGYLYQYLTFTPNMTRPDGPVVIYIEQTGNLGFVAFGYSLAEVIRERHPDSAIRIIIKVKPNKYSYVSKAFDFEQIGDPIKVAYVTGAEPDSQKALLKRWLTEASIVVSAASRPAKYVSDDFFCVNVAQIGAINEPAEAEEEKLNRLVPDFRQLSSMINGGIREFQRAYFSSITRYGEQSVFYDAQQFNISAPANQMVRAARQEMKQMISEAFKQGITDKGNILSVQCGQLVAGFSPTAMGMLERPSYQPLRESYNTQDGLFPELLLESPTLNQFLKQYAGSNPHYYMAYMHNWLPMAEYLATVSYLEPDAEPLILGNFSDWILTHKDLQEILRQHGIAGIYWHDLVNGHEPTVISFDNSDGRYLRVAKLPPIKNDKLYQSLFVMSENPVGVTGNQSLFMAIALEKLPFYDVNKVTQVDVRSHLANFDTSGLLRGFFSEQVNPEYKASIVKKGKGAIVDWSQSVRQNKSINDVLALYMDMVLNPSSELEQHLAEVHRYDSLPTTDLPEDPLLKDVVLVRRFFRTMRQISKRPDSRISIDWFRREVILIGMRLQDHTFRKWFLGALGHL